MDRPGRLARAARAGSGWGLVFNVKTAKALALAIPPSLLLRADEITQ